MRPRLRPAAAGWTMVLVVSAFLGGLILNVMPCVLPVIALKILGFVKQSAEQARRVRNLGLVYGVGVLVRPFSSWPGWPSACKQAGGAGQLGRHLPRSAACRWR